jgi:transcription elongation factor GreA
MSEELIRTVKELLNEEKWTRATLNSYTIHNFQELDEIIHKTVEAGVQKEVMELCEEHIKHTRHSIIALYLSGITALSKQLVDDSNLIVLINIFTDNHKWNIVEYLSQRILEFGENKYALRTLAEVYENKNEQENKLKIWERLIKVDYEEADIVKALAEIKEKEGDQETAIEYYKKAIHRFISRKMFANVKDIWERLIELQPDDMDFFFHVERKIVKSLNDERAANLLQSLYPYYRKKGDWDTAIEILKRILSHEPKNGTARKEIVDCFREKYKGHSHLEEYIKISNLTQGWRNVHDAIADFEKHISFDTDNFVFHRAWGIGKIVDIKNDVFIIDFPGKPKHKMSLKMAVNALNILADEHIWVMKSTHPKDELKKWIKQEPAQALKTIIRSYSNVASLKRIKSELVPDILTNSEWAKWSTEARKILKTDPVFGIHPERADRFIVRDKPISFEEKAFNRFKAERGFFDRVRAIQDFLADGEPDSEYFGEMFGYFTGFLKSFSTVTELVISSYLLVQRITAMHPYLKPDLSHTFKELYDQIEDVEEVFNRIQDADLKKEFLVNLKRYVPDWPEVFARLFIQYQSGYIIEELVQNKKWDVLKDLADRILGRYREAREPFVWLARNMVSQPRFAELGIPMEKVLIGLIHLLDITFREISNKREVSQNRKLNRQIQDFLFKEERLINYVLQAGEESITRLYTLVDDVKELNPALKIQLKHRIKEKYPDYRFLGEADREKVARGLMVTRQSYENKQRSLRHIIEVEIPDNSKEIGLAMSKGDLRENAEYKAALERQELLKSAASRLQEELQQAQIFDENHVDTETVSFGTRIRLKNTRTSEKEEYIILGPWESDPSKRIISYLSPLGTELSNRRKGEKLSFSINEQTFEYIVDEIEKAELKNS